MTYLLSTSLVEDLATSNLVVISDFTAAVNS